MKPRHPKCPNVHLGDGDKCRDCVRLYEQDERDAGSASSPVSSGVRDEAPKDIRKEADSAAKKQARYRAKHPDYVEREKARMRARRKK